MQRTRMSILILHHQKVQYEDAKKSIYTYIYTRDIIEYEHLQPHKLEEDKSK